MFGKSLTIRIGGDEGEGVLRCGEIVAEALNREKHLVLLHRGHAAVPTAPEAALLRSGERPPLSVGDSLDILFAWSQEAYNRFRDSLWPEGLLLYDPDAVRPREADAPIRHGVALRRLAAKHPVVPLAKSFLAAGVLMRLCGLAPPPHGEDEAEAAVLQTGYEYARRPPLGVVHYELDRWGGPPRSTLSGARATARGAAAAGGRSAVCVGEAWASELAVELSRSGLLVQGESDEAAALARARAAAEHDQVLPLLCAEGLAGLADLMARAAALPVVLVRVPAAGAVGAAADLGALVDLADAGPVFAPANIEECDLHIQVAFEVARRFRRPAALLLDPVLGDTLESVLDEVAPPPAVPARMGAPEAYRALARQWAEVHFPAGARVGIVSWGAMAGPIREARLEGEGRGLRVAHLHPRVLAPLAAEGMRRFLEPLSRVIVAEPDPTAPLAEVLRTHYQREVESLAWPAGAPLTPEAVLAAVQEG
jgi:2-oxoglutarate ferredoxin oxidoreductase subunit alpha